MYRPTEHGLVHNVVRFKEGGRFVAYEWTGEQMERRPRYDCEAVRETA